jgi:Zn-dependent protease with chaperone function
MRATKAVTLRAAAAVLVLSAATGTAVAGPREVKVQGYSEWREGDVLVVDGQRVRASSTTKLDLKGAPRTFAQIPLGYEVTVTGLRAADGSIRAQRVEARPNGSAMFEGLVREATNEAEEKYNRAGEFFFEEDSGRIKVVGKLHDSGPQVDRVRNIVDDLVPPYVDPARVRVYVIENREWNAFAMGNFAIYAFTGLLDDLDDDELAVVLGHEIAHATHEHTRRSIRKAVFIQLAALGVGLAAEEIDNKWHRGAVNVVAQLGALAWMSGYGRDQEDQADRVGLRYAWEAGYDVRKGPALWERFARRYGDGNKVANFFFSDHSASSVRARNLRVEMAANYPLGQTADRPAYAANRRSAPARAAVAYARAEAAKAPATATVDTPVAFEPVGYQPDADAAADASRQRLRAGMSTDEVRSVLGAPHEEVVFGGRVRWAYPDLAVVFDGGQVTDLRFY